MKILEPEVDVALVDYRRLKVVGKVKWKRRVTRKEVREGSRGEAKQV